MNGVDLVGLGFADPCGHVLRFRSGRRPFRGSRRHLPPSRGRPPPYSFRMPVEIVGTVCLASRANRSRLPENHFLMRIFGYAAATQGRSAQSLVVGRFGRIEDKNELAVNAAMDDATKHRRETVQQLHSVIGQVRNLCHGNTIGAGGEGNGSTSGQLGITSPDPCRPPGSGPVQTRTASRQSDRLTDRVNSPGRLGVRSPGPPLPPSSTFTSFPSSGLGTHPPCRAPPGGKIARGSQAGESGTRKFGWGTGGAAESFDKTLCGRRNRRLAIPCNGILSGNRRRSVLYRWTRPSACSSEKGRMMSWDSLRLARLGLPSKLLITLFLAIVGPGTCSARQTSC